MSEHAAIYLRLSREDGVGESESIASQRMLLLQYAAAHEIRVSAEFVDDGISGSRFDRAGLQEMLRAIEDGWITTVLVKDLSRLSRDYIRTGELIERWFPAHGARLIAVNDALDTGTVSQTADFSAMRAVMDDWYARDISHKVRAAIAARQRAGLCTASRLPYGYLRVNGAVQMHPEKAAIVQQIFALCRGGAGCTDIARRLNRLASAPPAGKGKWNDTAVRRILCNPAYTGTLHLRTTETHSYKCPKRRMLPPEAQIIYRIPALITEAEFEAANAALTQHAHRAPQKSWLSGRVFCGVCGAAMTASREGTSARLICGSRKRGGDCRNPSLRTDRLLALLRAALHTQSIDIPPKFDAVLIDRIVISETEIHVYLRFAMPEIGDSV